MQTYIAFEGKAFFFQKKILGILFLWLLLGLGLFAQILLLDSGNHEEALYNELNDTRIVLRATETYYRESETDITLADNLFEQQNLLAMKYNGIKFKESEWFYEAGIELARLRLTANEYRDEKVPTTLFPSRDVSERQLVEYEAMNQAQLPIRIDSKNLYDYSIKLLSIYGSLAFLFALLFSADVGLRDYSHQSVVKSYPLQGNIRLLIQTSLVAMGSTIGLLLLMGVNLGFVRVLWGTNDWLHPVGYYTPMRYQAIPLVQYIIKFSLYLFMLMMHTTLFSYLMNQLFKNRYVTLMIGGLAYAAGFLFSSNQAWIQWLPLPYIHVDSVLIGFLAEQVHPQIDFNRGLFILLVWGITFMLISFALANPRKRKENLYASH